jgi:hypothetical protein
VTSYTFMNEDIPAAGPMDPHQFKEAMAAIFPADGFDEEGAHSDADKLMCQLLISLGYIEGVYIFQDADKWYA